MKTIKSISIVVAVLLSLYAVPSIHAESMQYDDDNWHFISPTFYLWLFQVEGDVTAKGTTRDVDMSISDVLEKMDTGFQLYLEVDKGDWGFFVEPSLLGFSEETKVGGTKFKSDLNITLADFGATYRVWRIKDPLPLTVFAMAGGRYWGLELNVDTPGAGFKTTQHKDLIDPFIGFRVRSDLTEKLHLGCRFDIGGFDISSSQSDLTWQTWLLLNYDITKRFSVFGGYRALAVDYEEGGKNERGVDLVFHGPIIGLNFDIFGWLADRKK